MTALRPLRSSDVEALAAWLPRVAGEIGCDAWATADALAAAARRADALVYREPGGEGVLAYDGEFAQEAVRIELLAVAPGRRRLGVGSRAVLSVERKLRRFAARVYVEVPSDLGLAFYFWLRLGYRPLTQREWPVAPGSGTSAWMVRELR